VACHLLAARVLGGVARPAPSVCMARAMFDLPESVVRGGGGCADERCLVCDGPGGNGEPGVCLVSAKLVV